MLLGLIGVWYINFFGAETQAILPYNHYLARFPSYLQQLDMESNGKSVTLAGEPVDIEHRPGGVGHAGHQRPARLLPADPPGHPADPGRLHRLPRAQPRGRRPPRPADGQPLRPDRGAGVRQDRRRRWQPRGCRAALVPHRTFPGNHPTNTILAPRLTPRVLGELVATYEHKVFTQGVIWGINSFDQWGVELGKALAQKIVPQLTAAEEPSLDHDSSTNALIRRYRAARAGRASHG